VSTLGRPLGTGPSTTRSTPATDTAPRLLPVGRIEPAALLDEGERPDVAERNGRRTLGHGIARTPQGEQVIPLDAPPRPAGGRAELSAKTLFGFLAEDCRWVLPRDVETP
jgi:hypothetical protein